MNYAVVAAFLGMCVFYLAYQRMKRVEKYSVASQIAVKCAATAMAALVALLGCLKNGTAAHWVLLAGVAVCTVADGVLCVHFIPGGALFALGHVLYMTAFCLMNRPGWISAALFLLLMGLAATGIARFRGRIGEQYRLFYIYAALLSLMVAMGAAQPPLFLAGAMLFALSDGLLGVRAMKKGDMWLDYISLGTYYLGQFLLGVAVLIH